MSFRNTTVDLNSNNFETPANMTAWPSFHNGVAAGLRIADSSQVRQFISKIFIFFAYSSKIKKDSYGNNNEHITTRSSIVAYLC